MQKMTLMEAMERRHSVRSYTPEPIRQADIEALQTCINECNRDSGLHIQLVTGKPEAFKTLLTSYGWFKNVSNYIALVGKDTAELDELCGYYGEKLVLFAQQLGMGTCWVGGTFSRKKTDFEAAPGEKLCLIIAIGYPLKDGRPHKCKPMDKISNLSTDSPDWFRAGMAAVAMAPTAVNQQKFHFELQPSGRVKATGAGAFGMVDLGIGKYHFEIGSGKGPEVWC